MTNPITDGTKAHADARDLASLAGTQVAAAQRAYAGAELSEQQLLDRVKAAVQKHFGFGGTAALGSMLGSMDKSGDGLLSHRELGEGLRRIGVKLSARDLTTLFAFFDANGDGFVSLAELSKGLRGSLSGRRLAIVEEAFKVLDKTGDGVVSVHDLVDTYDTSMHPEVKAGRMSHEDVIKQMLRLWDRDVPDGVVTKEEFVAYYVELSATIDHDDYFELMIRNAWHISGGEGWAANTSNLRVLVTFTDGREEVVAVEQDLGLDADDVAAIKAALRRQGVNNVYSVKTAH
jgi:Ca2+-binding EF-hand superfamily protein